MDAVYILKEDKAYTELYDKCDDVRGNILGVYATEDAAKKAAGACVDDLLKEYSDEDGLYKAEVVQCELVEGTPSVAVISVEINERDGDWTDRKITYSIERHAVQI